MTRTKGTKKKQGKQVKKRSDFAIDRYLKCPPGSGLPSNYLYGDSNNQSRKLKSKSKLNRKRKQHLSKNAVITKKQVVNVKLHNNIFVNHDVPWWRNNQVDKVGNATSRGNTSRILNGFTVKESSLQLLNKELTQFGEYVKLTPAEREARQSLITKVQDICAQLFCIERSHCQVFGSFAVPSVCTFGSDIDLAIWGVVVTDALDDRDGDPVTKRQRKRSISLAESDGSFSQEEESGALQHLHDHPNRKKQERVLQWINAIDYCIEHTQELQKTSHVGSRDLGCSLLQSRDDDEQESGQADNEEKVEQHDQQECELFVLDRTVPDDEEPKQDLQESFDKQQRGDKRKASDDSSCASTSTEADNEQEEADDADKLERLDYWQGRDREQQHDGPRVVSLPPDNQIQDVAQKVKRLRGQSMASLSSATTCSEDDIFNDSGMEVSYIVGKPNLASHISGPTGRNRTAVINALYKMARRLKPYATTLQVRKKAREYLVHCVTAFL
jgi:hypothetical protein